jgi:acetylserotonin N-methyltransferase
MSDRHEVTIADIAGSTALNARGAEAFMGVLCALNVVATRGDGRFALENVGREYLDCRAPFYAGWSLYGMLKPPIPQQMLKGQSPRRFSKLNGTLWDRVQYRLNPYQWGRPERLRIQHSRNFAPAVIAARSGVFDGVRHLIDMGGGTGVFSIPLALDHPQMRITLVDLPRSVPHIREYLERYGVADRVEVTACDIHRDAWPLPECDGMLFANFMHSNDDDECRALLLRTFGRLAPGVRIFLHEMLWDERKDGPLVTALWNFWMISVSAGRQRTAQELRCLLQDAGFERVGVRPSAGSFSLMSGTKPV